MPVFDQFVNNVKFRFAKELRIVFDVEGELRFMVSPGLIQRARVPVFEEL